MFIEVKSGVRIDGKGRKKGDIVECSDAVGYQVIASGKAVLSEKPKKKAPAKKAK